MSVYRGLLSKLGLRKKKQPSPGVEAPIDSLGDLERSVLWASHGEHFVLSLPADRLVMQGGLRYVDPSHPFGLALEQGPGALAQYYSRHCPTSFCDFHRVPALTPSEMGLPVWELPWLHRVRRVAPPGEGGLGPEHGLSYCGPVTAQKVALEYQRLTALRDGILRIGYQPQTYGHIAGFFMVDDDGDYRFFVRGGKHRAAVLAHLNSARVPVTFKRDWPRVVRETQARYWPLVQNGSVSEATARAAFRRYTR